jgi:UDP-glucose 4-epimerase
MKNILVTGGAGYIGSHIIEILIRKKYKVVIVDNLETGYKQLIHKKAKFYNVDINNFKKIKKIIKENKIDTVIHLAASISINESKKNPKKFYKNNVIGTSVLVKACQNTLVKNFIFSSTAAVYKDTNNKVNETSKIKPKSIYGKTKKKAEDIIMNSFKNTKINYAILRYFNVVGASNNKKIGPIKKNDTLFKNLSMSIFKKTPIIRVYGSNYKTKDGSCVRDYVHVSDLADMHHKVLNKIDKTKKSVILNCGYGKGASVIQVAKVFIKYSKKKIKLVYEKRRTGDLASSIASNQKIKKYIKWSPKYNNLSTIVKTCIKWESKLTK